MFVKLSRSVAAVIGALILAFIGVVGVEWVSSILHPVPPGVDLTNMEACRDHVSRYPTGVLLLCLMGWWLTVFASGWMATRLGVSRHPAHGIVVGVILLALATFNMALLPYPSWIWVNLIAFPVSSFGGILLGRSGMRVEREETKGESQRN